MGSDRTTRRRIGYLPGIALADWVNTRSSFSIVMLFKHDSHISKFVKVYRPPLALAVHRPILDVME